MDTTQKMTFDTLAVTNVQVFPFANNPDFATKAMATIVLNDQIQIRGLRVCEGENGLYIGFPRDPFFKGEDFRSLVAPVTRRLREEIETAVLEKYQQAMA